MTRYPTTCPTRCRRSALVPVAAATTPRRIAPPSHNTSAGSTPRPRMARRALALRPGAPIPAKTSCRHLWHRPSSPFQSCSSSVHSPGAGCAWEERGHVRVLEAVLPVARSRWMFRFDRQAWPPMATPSLMWPAWHGTRRSPIGSAMSSGVAAALGHAARSTGGQGAGHPQPTTVESRRPLGVVRHDRRRAGRPGAATGHGRPSGGRGHGRWCSAAWPRRGQVAVPRVWRLVRGAPGGPPDLLARVRPP